MSSVNIGTTRVYIYLTKKQIRKQLSNSVKSCRKDGIRHNMISARKTYREQGIIL